MDNQEISQQDSQASTTSETVAPEGAAAAPAPEQTIAEKIADKAAKSVSTPAQPSTAATPAQIAEYKANFKFKAAGKEMEVPEFLRGVIKDADSEKYLHSVLSKAHGLEMVQSKLRETREAREQVQQAYQQVMQPIEYAREAYQRNDMDSVFDTLKIDPNKVLQWAYNKVQLSQMPADQRQVYEARTQAEKRAFELERQNAQYQQQSVAQQSEQIGQMLEIVLERPDYSAVAQAYDARKGTPGAFRNLVIQMGDQAYNQTGKVISPVEAAKAAVDLLGEKLSPPAQQATQLVQQQQQAVQQTPAPSVPQKITLPNPGSSKSASPAKSKIKTLDDIRKAHQKFQNA